MVPCVHTFNYFTQSFDSNGNPKPKTVRHFVPRDAAASRELHRTLEGQGFSHGEALLNFPPDSLPPDGLAHVDVSDVEPLDIISLLTRTPLDDQVLGDRKRVPRGYTDLEEVIFKTMRVYLGQCARSTIQLSNACAAKLAPAYEQYAAMAFTQRPQGHLTRIKTLQAPGWNDCQIGARGPETVVFLVRTAELWQAGPGFVAAFGLSGDATFAWAYRLGHDLAHFLEDEQRFIVARMPSVSPPARPTTSHWARDFPVEVMLDLRGDSAAPHVLDPGFVPAPRPA